MGTQPIINEVMYKTHDIEWMYFLHQFGWYRRIRTPVPYRLNLWGTGVFILFGIYYFYIVFGVIYLNH